MALKPNLVTDPKPIAGIVYVPCDACKGSGKMAHPADSRNIVNKGPCTKCDGRGKIGKQV